MARRERFSQWFDDQLDQAGLSGKELATLVGVSEATISRVRNGRVPLSPKMKARLSLALNAKLGDIPKIETKVISQIRPLWTIQHAVPAPAAVNYALKQGLFAARGITVNELADRDLGLKSSVRYFSAIEECLAKGQSVLAVGPELEFHKNGLKPTASVFSHTYQGYQLISRASTAVPALDLLPQHQRIFNLKVLFEQLENAHVWRHGFDRFSWQSSTDLEFLKTLRALSSEMTGVVDHNDFEPLRFSNKPGLHTLRGFGTQGVDFALVDASALAEVYAHPDEYKVLLSLNTLSKTIQGFSGEGSPALVANLKQLYRSDNASVAVERFKTHWLDRLAQLEVPVYWHLFCPEGTHRSEYQPLMDGVAGALQDFQQTLSASHLRESVIVDIQQYCDSRSCQTVGAANAESFRLAWDACYSGL